MNRIIALALEYRFLVLFGVLILIIGGVVSLQQLPIDAVPDITPNQVLVLAQAPGLSPLEVEQFLSYPVETAMSGLPGVTRVQSVSKNGLSYVALYFRDDVNIYFARQLVLERLPELREPSQQSWRFRKWDRSPRAWARSTSSRLPAPAIP